ncbi:MAG: DUF2938 family protein [Hyphomonadaceae bacterium]|nr:DUF2938 family protein [Hyphomonadaceae bacterium]
MNAILIGIGATAFMDLTSVVRAWLGAPFPDYGLVGRWLAHVARGRVRHDAIATSAAVEGEALIGWGAHYAIGVGYAALLLTAWPAWAAAPSLAPAMFVGVATVLAPFLIMQPGMGAGLFASRMADPGLARLRSLTSHALFGLGLYAAGLARAALLP